MGGWYGGLGARVPGWVLDHISGESRRDVARLVASVAGVWVWGVRVVSAPAGRKTSLRVSRKSRQAARDVSPGLLV